jgi:hypothetical protein
LEVGGRRFGGRRMEVGRLEAGGWKGEVGSWKI